MSNVPDEVMANVVWGKPRDGHSAQKLALMRAALSALEAAGWAVVPVEATNAMMDAGIHAARRELPPLGPPCSPPPARRSQMSEGKREEFSEISAAALSMRLCQKADFYESANGGWRDITAALLREADRRLSALHGLREVLRMAREFAEAEAEMRGSVDETYAIPAAVLIEKIDAALSPQDQAKEGSER